MSRSLLITGTSGGLGLAIVVKAAKAGNRVYATMRDPSRRAALDAALLQAGATATVLQLDVRDQASVDAAVAQMLAETGGIDCLVNNAGAGFVRTVEQASATEIDWVLDVNLTGVIRCTKAVLPAMRAARAGRVVTISSVGGLVGQPFNELYCAAKFGVEGFMESLASYVGPAFNIHFSLVEPGGIASDFNASVMQQFAAGGGMRQDDYLPLLQAYIGGVQSRAGAGGSYQTTDEVADVVLDCLADPKPPVRLRTSSWAEAFTALKTAADPDGRKLQAEMVARNFGTLPLVQK
ncbi:MAG: SDR family oxidoreductase [Rhodobacterales bacterium]|nr:SDR family oxidoreductase [Rhodobacterales bacterium]